jgi:hypothetical protein
MLIDVAMPSVLFSVENLQLVVDIFRRSFKGNFPYFAIGGYLRTSLMAAARTIWILEASSPTERQKRCAAVLYQEWYHERQSWQEIQKAIGLGAGLGDVDYRVVVTTARLDAIIAAFPSAKNWPRDTHIIGSAGEVVDAFESPAKDCWTGSASMPWRLSGLYAWRTGSGWAHGLQWPIGRPGTSLASYPKGMQGTWMVDGWQNGYKAAYVFIEVAAAQLAAALGVDSL